MTKERFDWILSGLDRNRLNRDEKLFIRQIEQKIEELKELSQYQGKRLEQIYRSKSR